MLAEHSASYTGARLTIDLQALRTNYRLIAARVAPAQAAAVVKADAYGLGVARAVPALAEEGCRHFFVAHLSEANNLVPFLPSGCTAYVLNGLPAGAESYCIALGAVPVLNSIDQAQRWVAAARRTGKQQPAAYQIDSGMSRLGMQPTEVEALRVQPDIYGWAPPALIMSHLACADEPAHAANAQQLAYFLELASQLPPAPLSIANSGGTFLPHPFHLDLVRPGVSLYGVAPQMGMPNPMHPVVRLDARVIQLRSIPVNAGVGYGLTFKARRNTCVATVAVGYADGWPRALSNRGAAYFRGVRLPIAGRISMDSMSLDVTALPESSLAAGDFVELLGPNQSLEDVAAAAETIPYEILTSLGRRYSRVYL